MIKYQKRNSPPYSAQKYPNKIEIGNDGFEYVSRSDKNKVCKWYKIKSVENCPSAEKYYMQFPDNYLQKKFNKYDIHVIENKLSQLKKELFSKNIYILKIGWKNVYDYTDNAWYEAEKYIKDKHLKDKSVSTYDILDLSNFIFYTEKSLFWSKNTGNLRLQWNLKRESKKIAFEILNTIFKNNFVKPLSSSKEIIIKIPKK